MTEVNDTVKESSYDDEMSRAFDQTLPKLVASAGISSTRIAFKRRSGATVTIELEHDNQYHRAIFKTFYASSQTSWFRNLSERSQIDRFETFKGFVNWLNNTEHETFEVRRYQCLKDDESSKMNDEGCKSSPIKSLIPAFKAGLGSKSLTEEEYSFMTTLLRLSKAARNANPEPYTLTDWLALPWLRSILGEHKYLSLESPSRLLTSFRVTVAATLSYLLEVRARWQKQALGMTEPQLSQNSWFESWNINVLQRCGAFEAHGEPADDLTRLLLLDFTRPDKQAQIKLLIAREGLGGLRRKPYVDGKPTRPWQPPALFHPEYQHSYSPLEECLMAWLVACETVQPTDINKLKTTDYAYEHNSSGRLIAMQCRYYKGRAGSSREPAMLMASDCWTKAQYAYINGLPYAGRLFSFDVSRQKPMPNITENPNSISRHTDMILLWNLWQLPQLQSRIANATKAVGTPTIFLDAVLALKEGSETWHSNTGKSNGTLENYRNSVSRPLPTVLFSLTHIKTTAVHAGSDQYREGDLINHHSHTSRTEKHSYLTDANKDFVNRAGRITRLILNDLENVVYQPSVSSMANALKDLELRSRVIDATGSDNAQVQTLYPPSKQHETDGLIIVPDTVEQALMFIHAIDQAENKYKQLLTVRPDWVERTLLVQLEWMTRTLQKMRSESAAREQYRNLKPHLPPMFDHFLETQE
ncbi:MULTISPECIES: hypothetical protein [Marinobacter]|uniref:hypothetical protein n=1 Tax=Marinobacter TaxID=2742 RepID=UPI001B1D3B3A|nr:hypothetical protein [Marinobacter sp.]MBO6811025.1 hypothetical protein [Marinobacter sp.]MBO6873054.1 hypothetical protein [Marinobacter sp.]